LGQRDAVFLDAMMFTSHQHVWTNPDAKIPRLMAMARDYREKPIGAPLPPIYTFDTCHEFQRVFRRALHVFRKSLTDIRKFRNRQPRLDEMDMFENIIHSITTSGLILRSIAYTSFFKDHLERLDLPYPPVLGQEGEGDDDDDDDDDDKNDYDYVKDKGKGRGDGVGKGEGTDDKNENEGADNDNETELDDIDLLPAREYSLASNEYAKWTWWLVAHFDAANNLLESVFKENKSDISVWVIGAKVPMSKICDWEDIKKQVQAVAGVPSVNGLMANVKTMMKVKEETMFINGTQHCEATLAAMITNGDLPVSVDFTMFTIEPDTSEFRMPVI
jgi:hypothetical protein